MGIVKDEITRIEILNNITDQDKSHINEVLDLYKGDILDLAPVRERTSVLSRHKVYSYTIQQYSNLTK